ncbi:hypothetical protein PHSY_001912 [Pseudozyma hubeiensis SY62]|uniref:Uncharacterized protein n=1 Tax=Pseudozyma hubeiensis (strain SY62) TaxID=1305764 RepID=R9NZV0_PSEHS|nr:hypothetical protein PHSY_001912 [Pseudozyma hubeiensis SY62]GAC94341.1 hypothetical protein PHSY_001912 [Pseudozyma hubeiensis SY62]
MTMPFASKAIVSVRPLARGIASSASRLAEGSTPSPSATSSSASASRPRPNSQSQRSPQSRGGASDRLRAGQRTRNSASQRGGEGSGAKSNNNNNNRNAGSDRRNKRLPSVFDATSASNQARAGRGSNNKSLSNTPQKLSAPLPKTDWNNPLFSKPGFERLLSSAPRPSSVFIPDLAAAAPSAPAAAGKGKGKAAAAPAAKTASAKLNLPGIKTANSALKLHIVPGARNVLGPTNNPTSVAAGFLTHTRAALTRSSDLRASDDKSLAEQLKAARIALQNEQIGGSYERFQAQSLLKATGVQTDAKQASLSTRAVQDAAQALAVNSDLAPEGKRFVTQTIADRLGS